MDLLFFTELHQNSLFFPVETILKRMFNSAGITAIGKRSHFSYTACLSLSVLNMLSSNKDLAIFANLAPHLISVYIYVYILWILGVLVMCLLIKLKCAFFVNVMKITHSNRASFLLIFKIMNPLTIRRKLSFCCVSIYLYDISLWHLNVCTHRPRFLSLFVFAL